MRHLLLRNVFFLLSLTLGTLYAQYHPFPIENSTWVNRERTFYLDQNNFPVYTTTWNDKYCTRRDDTTINTLPYSPLYFCTPAASVYHGALRYFYGQLFFIPKDSAREFLVYDFTKEAGDSVEVMIKSGTGFTPHYYSSMVYINSVDTVIVNGTPRRRLYTQGYEWIEGIGCTSGLFMEPWFNISNYIRELICMSHDDTTHFDGIPLTFGASGSCDLSLSSSEQVSEELMVEVFPNPSSGVFTIRFGVNEHPQKIQLLNSWGQEVSYNLYIKQKNYLLMMREGSGLFYLKVTFNNGHTTWTKLIKY